MLYWGVTLGKVETHFFLLPGKDDITASCKTYFFCDPHKLNSLLGQAGQLFFPPGRDIIGWMDFRPNKKCRFWESNP